MADDRDDRAWRARVIDECSRDVEAGLDHSLHNAPGRVRLARAALERLCRAVTRCPDEAVEAARLDEQARCAVRMSRILDRNRAEARVEGMEAAIAVADEYEAQARREARRADDRVVHAAFADGARDVSARIFWLVEAERRSRAALVAPVGDVEEDDAVAPAALASSRSRLEMMARGEAWPVDARDRAVVARSIRLVLDRLSEVEQCAAILGDHANPEARLR